MMRTFRSGVARSDKGTPGRSSATGQPLFEQLEPRRLLDAGPLLLSELMAINDGTLADGDGDYSDWIEIHNPTQAEVSLAGWYLTDDVDDRVKWQFPDVSLGPGEYRVVFASDKDRADPAELHTNFKLSGGGEYLGLVQSDGTTISHDYSPGFPQQFADVSYGLSQGTATSTLIAAGANARVLVPPDGSLAATWTATGFSDGGWTLGTTGVGYDRGPDYGGLIGLDVEGAMRGVNSSAYVRAAFDVADPSVFDSLLLRMKYDDGFAAYLNGVEVARRNAPATPWWNSSATAEHGQPVSTSMAQNFDAGGTAYDASRYGSSPGPQVIGGGPRGNYLRLINDGQTSNINRISFDRVHEGPSSRVTADFDFRFDSSDANNPADGLAFILLPTSTYGDSGPGSDGSYPSEEPNLPGAFAVGFDLYPEPSGVNDVSAHFGGTEIVNVRMSNAQIDLDAGVFHHAHIELVEVTGGARVTVTLTPNVFGAPGAAVTPINNVMIPGFTPYESRVEFSGRTGGLHVDADLDNIAVEFGPVSDEIAYEDIDLSGQIGLLQAGGNVLAVHGLNITRSDNDFLVLPELVAVEALAIQPDVVAYFTTPTPGAVNDVGSEIPSEAPTFSHTSGTYVSSFWLTLSVDSPGAAIHYTTDGSIPTEFSSVYGGPISINTTSRIRARAVEPGHALGPVVSQGYVFLDGSAANFSSDVPLIVVDTYGGGLGDTLLTPSTSVFIETGADGRARITDAPEFAGRSGIRIRGQSSQGWPKKQYAFETWAEGNEDTAPIAAQYSEDLPVSLFGMPAESDWVIQGPYSDKTLMRNYLAYSWSNDIGSYAPRVRFCEVFVNTGGGKIAYPQDYVGSYVFMEKIKRDPNRVDIAELTPQDNQPPEVSGGYIYKKDKSGAGDQPWTTSRGQQLRHVDPKARDITAQQQAYLQSYINEFESVLYGANFKDPVNGYAKYIDVDSWIDHWIVVELCKNIDGFRLSTYYHKDRGGKIVMGPVWDYNLSLGNADYLDGWLPAGWYGQLISDAQYPYWDRLFEDPDFKQRLVDRWHEFRQDELSTDKLLSDVDAAAAVLGESQARNFQKWQIQGVRLWPNWYVGATWQEEVDWMKWWIGQRVGWMDSQFTTAVDFSQDGGVIGPGFELGIDAPTGAIYYTLDGTDPRQSGGGVANTALTYRGANVQGLIGITDQWAYEQTDTNLGTAWRARTYNDSAWPRGDALLYVEGSALPAPKNTPLTIGADTYYFRTHFDFQGDPQQTELQMRTVIDDGAVFYLNGQEVYRLGMDAGAVNHGTRASRTVGNANWEGPFSIPTAALRQNDNVLAVEVHQASANSSDIVLGIELDALTTAGGSPIPLTETTLVKARANSGSEWSAPKKAVFLANTPADAANLAVTEINYHPAPPTPDELATQPPGDEDFTDDDFEFIELRNLSGQTIDVAGVQLVDGIVFDFAEHGTLMLGPNEHLAVVANEAAFATRYGMAGALVAGEFEGQMKLANNGERIELTDAFEATLFDFIYDDGGVWPGRADGKGATLELIDPAAVPQAQPLRTAYLQNGDNWRSSSEYGGSPGAAGSGPIGDVVVNEVLSHTDPPLVDTIELHNLTGGPIDVSGWYLSDSWGWQWSPADGNYRKFPIPDQTSIPAGGYLVFDETDFNPSGGLDPELHPNDFALNGAHGDDVWLMEADVTGELVRFVDHAEFGAQAQGESWGRWPDGTGRLYPMESPTLDKQHPENGPNSGPRVGPVVFSEVHYNPDAGVADDDFEFLEIYNNTGAAVNLTNWRIRRDVDFDFPAATVLAAHSPLVIVPFEVTDSAKLTAFRTRYGIDASVAIVGGYTDRLGDDGGRVELQRPDEEPAEEPGFIPRLLEDEVRYEDGTPWPAAADGGGHSLQRTAPDAWANSYQSWQAAAPTPGSTAFVPVVQGEVVGRHVFYNNSVFDGNGTAAGPADDAAIAPDKQALLPGQTATLANYTGYDQGINGIMIDVDGMEPFSTPTADDFRFRIGNSDAPGDWETAPNPTTITVRPSPGPDGSDRITLIWPAGTISKQWLQVTVLATPITRLPEDDVFYFGNAIGEAGNSASDAKVGAIDMLGARDNQRGFLNPAPIDFPYDFNRDTRVNTIDMLIARNNQTHFLNALKLITVPGAKSGGGESVDDAVSDPAEKLAGVLALDEMEHRQRSSQDHSREKAIDELLMLFSPR